MESYRLYVGVDWATEKHQVCVVDRERRVVLERVVEHKADALRTLADELLKLVEDRPADVAVAIETPRGAVVETFVERGFHVYAVNPKQLDRFRDRHTVAGVKDDRLDAFVLADSARTDLPCFRRVRPDDPQIVQIRELSRVAEDLKVEFNQLSNRLREQVHRVLPQLLTLSPAADEPWLWDLLELMATPRDAARVRPSQVARVLKNHRIRRLDADEVIAELRRAPPWVSSGTQEAVQSHIALLLPRVRVAHEQTRRCNKQIEELLEQMAADPGQAEGEIREHRDVQILQSLPGAGRVVVATMLAEASRPLAERSYHALRAHGGVAPVTRATGKRSQKAAQVVMRYSCNGRLRNAFFYWAHSAVQGDQATKAYYARLRQRGHTHGRALRSVADRLLRILVAMLNARSLYDASRASKALAPALS